MEQKQFRTKPTNEMFELKPFDKVLVRDGNQSHWRCAFFSHITMNNGDTRYNTTCSNWWNQCIPYNEKTAHLIGTNNDYQKPEPKEYHVWTSGTFNEWFTKTEFEKFIKIAVINNKDIKDFHVLYVKHLD
jgi:hypothetical protein